MRRKKFQSIMAIAIVIFHIGVFALVGLLALGSGFDLAEVTATFSVLTPFLATFMTIAIGHVTATMSATKDDSDILDGTYIVVSCLVFGAFAISLIFVVVLSDRGVLGAQELTGGLGAVESAFGIYAGTLARSLFAVAPQQQGPATP